MDWLSAKFFKYYVYLDLVLPSKKLSHNTITLIGQLKATRIWLAVATAMPYRKSGQQIRTNLATALIVVRQY